jgi:hypothetical protein
MMRSSPPPPVCALTYDTLMALLGEITGSSQAAAFSCYFHYAHPPHATTGQAPVLCCTACGMPVATHLHADDVADQDVRQSQSMDGSVESTLALMRAKREPTSEHVSPQLSARRHSSVHSAAPTSIPSSAPSSPPRGASRDVFDSPGTTADARSSRPLRGISVACMAFIAALLSFAAIGSPIATFDTEVALTPWTVKQAVDLWYSCGRIVSQGNLKPSAIPWLDERAPCVATTSSAASKACGAVVTRFRGGQVMLILAAITQVAVVIIAIFDTARRPGQFVHARRALSGAAALAFLFALAAVSVVASIPTLPVLRRSAGADDGGRGELQVGSGHALACGRDDPLRSRCRRSGLRTGPADRAHARADHVPARTQLYFIAAGC